MRIRILAAALMTVTLAAWSDAPAASAPHAAPRKHVTNQPPVAVITYTSRIITGGKRYTLSSASSYDPDGTIDSRFWANNCWPQPESTQVTTTIDVAVGTSCSVTLELWDNEGAFGSQEVILSN